MSYNTDINDLIMIYECFKIGKILHHPFINDLWVFYLLKIVYTFYEIPTFPSQLLFNILFDYVLIFYGINFSFSCFCLVIYIVNKFSIKHKTLLLRKEYFFNEWGKNTNR